jgi:glutathione S-transferase
MLTLHYAPNTISLATHIALEEAGAQYELVRLDFSANEQRGEAYRRINPKGGAPALVTDEGILTETPALLFYVAQTHPTANLAPLDDPFALAKVQAFNAYLCSTVHPSHSMRLRGARWSDDPAVIEALKVKVPANMAACYTLIEAEMFEGPWVMGEAYSIVDPYLFILELWMRVDGCRLEDFPKLAEHNRRMRERPAVQRALAMEGMD